MISPGSAKTVDRRPARPPERRLDRGDPAEAGRARAVRADGATRRAWAVRAARAAGSEEQRVRAADRLRADRRREEPAGPADRWVVRRPVGRAEPLTPECRQAPEDRAVTRVEAAREVVVAAD